MARQIEAERAGKPMPMGMEGVYPGKAEPIGTVERLLIGTSPLDQDQNISTAERVGRKTLDIVGRTPRAILGGASRGIGKAIAIQLSNAGAKVVVSSRKLEECKKVADEIKNMGGKAEVIPCHVGRKDEICYLCAPFPF